MRAGTHEVTLAGGRLVLPLTMNALRILGRIPANPLDVKAGPVDPGKILRGEQDITIETTVDCLVALGITSQPGLRAEDVLGMATQKALTVAMYEYCLAFLKAMGPEREVLPPKA